VPRFGAWAGASLRDGPVLRRVDSSGADEFAAERPVRVHDLGEQFRDLWLEALDGPQVLAAPVSPDLCDAFGVPGGVAEQLAAPDGVLVTAPIATGAGITGVLSIVAAGEPDEVELASFVTRVRRAVSAACVYEERATLAATLRDSLVPAPLPEIPGLQLGASYRPAQEATEIGGDFYDVMPRPDGSWAVSIGDVCGKGVDAAVLTGQVRQSLRTASLMTDDPATTLHLVNATMFGADGSTFVTVVYGLLDVSPTDGGMVSVRMATGGHPAPLVMRGGDVSALPVRGTILGMLPEIDAGTVEVTLGRGDLLLMFTDGAVEARGATGMLGVEPLADLLADSADLTAQAVTERLLQRVMEHLHGWPHDDIALLALRCIPAAS
jgi:sigma-B regulation protein RsbU (phosphoserine phosphatase)